MDCMAVLRVDIGFCIRVILWALVVSSCRIHVLLGNPKYSPSLDMIHYILAGRLSGISYLGHISLGQHSDYRD